MLSPYHILAKKSIYCLVCLLALFFLVDQAKAYTPNDPQYSLQADIYQQINLPKAWNYTFGSDKVVVAVIDIGVDIENEDLIGNIWQNKDEIANNGLDDDNNGYIDDVHGWNFVDDNNQVGVPEADTISDSEIVSHGTMVSGLIGAVGDNGLFGAGINWRVRIMPLRAINNTGGGSFASVVKAINYAVDNGADIINLSMVGSSSSTILDQTLLNAYKQGVLIVASAGNRGLTGFGDLDVYPYYPVCSDKNYVGNYILGVTSVNRNDRLSSFSSYGSCVDIAAPGENINSTLYYQPDKGFTNKFGGQMYGTSFSAPLVSGAAALVKSIVPSWGAKEIMANLLKNSNTIDNLNPLFINQLGVGRLNIGQAIQAARQDNSFLADSFNNLFFYQNNQIYNYNLAEDKYYFIDRINDAELIDMAMADIDDNNFPEGVLLIKRDKYYYIRIIKKDGSFIREFVLFEDDKINAEYNSIDIIKDGIIVEENNHKDRSLVKYSFKGKKLKDVYIGRDYQWSVNTDKEIILAKVVNDQLVLESIDWQGKIQNNWSLPRVQKLYDLKVGDVRKDGRQEQIVLVGNGSKIKLLVVDLPSGSWLANSLTKFNWSDQWRLLLGPYGGVVLPYRLKGGKFSLLKEGSNWLKEVELPETEIGREYKMIKF